MSGRAGRGVSAAVAFVAGLAVAAQGRINGELGAATGDGVLAAAVNFGAGLVVLLAVVLARGATRSSLRRLPPRVRSAHLRWWTLLGGLGGAVYVSSQSAAVPVLGVALFTVATVAGQTGTSLVVDRVGLGPGGARPVTGARVLAAVLATVAVWVGAGGAGAIGGSDAGLYLGLALAAGAAGAVQVALNGRVTVVTGQAAVAALVNFVVGLGALLALLAVQRAVDGAAGAGLAPVADRPWLLLGGVMGAGFVVGSAWAVDALGVLLLSLLVLAGTLVGAVAVDLALPSEGVIVTLHLLLGIGLTCAAVGLALIRRRGGAA